MKIILFHLEILEVRRPKYKKEKALIQQVFPKMRSPFFDKKFENGLHLLYPHCFRVIRGSVWQVLWSETR